MNVGNISNLLKRVSDNTGRLMMLALLSAVPVQEVLAGASCVVAKRLGHSLAIEWVASPQESAESALRKAEGKLIEQGYRTKGQDVHAQAATELPNGYMVIIKTEYTTATGRTRTSYGCGYSARSENQAGQAALYDLQNYSWGWKPEYGYEVVESFRY
ncbi:MAG: hypothetical protein KZQ75_11140 [Candidatus Thiodiazotropha sp. (ex Myrtea spinifera)]|nr:hypothetical protein [Candidatus Thiodiazotropha sp. (ex Myrtea spinifera)]MCU7827920.1 hypothetical protein [Candidatus Thiodiazotropha sp. (ex Myrtea sp. 'scaly one' KF741663)]